MTYENLRSIIKTEPKLIEELVLSNGHPRFLIKLKDGRELQLLNPSVNQLEELCDLTLTQEIPFKYCCKSKAH